VIGTSSNGKSFDLLDTTSINWREELERACSSLDAITPVYLPIVQLTERHACGYELLARFSQGPAVPPSMWFETAAELGLTAPLERRIMRAGFTTADQLPDDAFVSINITAEALVSSQIQELFRQRERYDNIVLEVSEKDSQQSGVADALTAFRAGGGRLAIDDIGAGFINLRDVLSLKPDILKADRALIRGIDRDRIKAAIVEGLNTTAKQLDTPLLAEGIESRDELAVLEKLGVPLGQGYLFGEPTPSFAQA
jgi:EAL domain-containing protein (putative c-di-GMP-specific phosphodiesterase class I)